MGILAEAFGDRRVVVAFPRTGVEDWVAVGEVLLQEGLSAWALPPEMLPLAGEVLSLFGHRARVGAYGVTDAAGVRAAVASGLHFVAASVDAPGLAAAGAGVVVLPGALTPTEVAAAVAAGAEAVLVTPVEALGTSYARLLPPLFGGVALVAAGRLERFQCEMWLDAGAAAVLVAEVVLKAEEGGVVNTPDEVATRARALGGIAKN